MGVLSAIKNLVGGGSDETTLTFECGECGATFESYMDPEGTHLRCQECRSTDVEPVSGD